MKTNIRGHKTEITDVEKVYITDKIGKLDKLFANADEIDVNVVVKHYDFETRVEVAVHADRFVIRADVREKDAKSAIDVAIDKLERQLRKHKTKLQRKFKERLSLSDTFLALEDVEEFGDDSQIKKTKMVELLAMDAEEAVLQLQLISHGFYMYIDIETNKPAVIYERNDGKYGVLLAE